MTEDERRLLVAVADALAIVLIRNPSEPLSRGAHLAWERLQQAMLPFGVDRLWLLQEQGFGDPSREPDSGVRPPVYPSPRKRKRRAEQRSRA